jgi:hypothetical protein
MIRTVALTLIAATATSALVIAAHVRRSEAQAYQAPCIARMPQLARRLHVAPTAQPSMLVVDGCNGYNYDIIAVLNAVLDRLDRAERGNPGSVDKPLPTQQAPPLRHKRRVPNQLKPL